MIKKLIAIPITFIFYILLLSILLIFHIIQVITLKLIGYNAHKRSVDIMCFCINQCFLLLGSRIIFKGLEKLPQGRPLIIVANHQSTWEIPVMMWYFRKHHPKFIAKKELSKNIPSLSFALRNGGHTFIDRKSGDAAVQEVYKLGETIEKNNWSVCIYPEGTRSYNGVVKRFQHGGTRSLITASPSALIVPLAIKNNYKLQPNKYFMFDLGVTMEFVVLEPIDPVDLTPEEAINKAELLIKQELKQA